MPEGPVQIRRLLTPRTERKELLELACAVDRVAWAAACRPVPRHPAARIARDLLGYLEPFGSLLPGRLGRWVRGTSFFTRLAGQFGWLRF